MRAERSRGSRIRSQSLPNELIEKDIRQKRPGSAGLLFLADRTPAQVAADESLARPWFYRHMTDSGLSRCQLADLQSDDAKPLPTLLLIGHAPEIPNPQRCAID